MTWFSARTTSDGVVSASRDRVWSVLTDPHRVARLTPFVSSITADGDLWRWEMTGVQVLGRPFHPCFTERMTFDEPTRIDYTHAPPDGTHERTGVEGTYRIADQAGETHLSIELTVHADLPLPRASGPAVRAAMRAVMGTMGAGFERSFRRELARTG